MNIKKNNSKKLLSFLSYYLKPFKSEIIIVLFSIAVVSIAILGLGYALRYLIDQGFSANDASNLNNSFVLLISMVLLLSFASYSRSVRVNWICESLEARLKKDAYKNIIKISPSYFELTKVSDLISRLTTDLGLIGNSLMLITSYSLRNALMAVGGLILLSFNSIKLTLYMLVVFPIIILPLIIIGRKSKKLSKENQQDIANSNAHIEETLNFIKAVQSYNREEFEYKKFSELMDKNQAVAHKRIKLKSLLFALVISLILSAVALVLWVGGQDVLLGKMSPGSLSSFVFYAVLVATSMGSLSEVYSDWQRASGALERVMEVIQAKSNIIDPIEPEKLNNKFNIMFDKVDFSYQSRLDSIVLSDISFDIPAGEVVALVGPSGAGKSTIFNLLLRFYDPSSGSITIDGVDIKEVGLSDLRSKFAFVSQDPIIFSGTVYDNILYGKIEAKEEEVIEAAKAAEIFDFFKSLPKGLYTYVGEKGIELSGGQKQRIAIARAILRNPKTLLLDEATSALDSENEKLVQLALSRLRKDKTTFVIAHRMSTISNADLIIVIDKGRIVAKGNHDTLLASNELYKKLSNDMQIKKDGRIV